MTKALQPDDLIAQGCGRSHLRELRRWKGDRDPAGRRADQITPDGANVSYIVLGQTAEKLPLSTAYKVPIAGGTPEKLFDVPEARVDRVNWAEERTAVVAAFSATTNVSNLWRFTMGAGRLTPLTDFRSGLIFELAASQDTQKIYFTQGSNNHDIIKITGLVK